MSDDFTRGIEARNRMFGEDRTKHAFANPDPMHHAFQTLVTGYCFGALWGSDGAPWRDRSLMTMSMVAAQHRFAEFETHLRLAIRNGCDKETIFELVRHVTVYCGVPSGFEAFRIMQKVYGETKAAENPSS